MKHTVLGVLSLVLAASVVSAVAVPPSQEGIAACHEAGFDFLVAEYGLGESGFSQLSQDRPGYTTTLVGDANGFSFTSSRLVHGLIVFEQEGQFMAGGGESGKVASQFGGIQLVYLCGNSLGGGDHQATLVQTEVVEVPEFGLLAFGAVASVCVALVAFRRRE